MKYLVAIDGGGTSCRAVVATMEGKRIGSGVSGPANIMSDMQAALRNICEASVAALQDADLDESQFSTCSAVLGLAGANIGDRDRLLHPLLPFGESHIVTDGLIALRGALGDDDGAVGIVGTGSVFLAQHNKVSRSIGGWGFAVGDFCSGARLGRTLLQEVLLAHDEVHPGSSLTDTIMNEFRGSPNTLVEFAQTARPGDFGTLAPILFDFEEQGDPIAVKLVERALDELEENLHVLIGDGDLPFCLLGGLAENYSKRLRPGFKRREMRPKGNALQGALSITTKKFGAQG